MRVWEFMCVRVCVFVWVGVCVYGRRPGFGLLTSMIIVNGLLLYFVIGAICVFMPVFFVSNKL